MPGCWPERQPDSADARPPWTPTEDNILGPYHRAGAPFRAKITPPLEPGTVLVIRGRVWGLDTQPLKNTVLDIWQANATAATTTTIPTTPRRQSLRKSSPLITDENGYYEYETIHPGAYKIGPVPGGRRTSITGSGTQIIAPSSRSSISAAIRISARTNSSANRSSSTCAKSARRTALTRSATFDIVLAGPAAVVRVRGRWRQ